MKHIVITLSLLVAMPALACDRRPAFIILERVVLAPPKPQWTERCPQGCVKAPSTMSRTTWKLFLARKMYK